MTSSPIPPPARLTTRRGSVDWSAVAALAAVLASLASLLVAVAVLRETRGNREWQQATAALDTLWRFDGEWNDSGMAEARSAAASALLSGRNAEELSEVLDFFDEIAFLAERGAIDDQSVWYRFYWPMVNYWFASREFVEETRREDAASWNHLARLIPRLTALEAKLHPSATPDGVPDRSRTRQFLQEETEARTCEDEGVDVRRMPL